MPTAVKKYSTASECSAFREDQGSTLFERKAIKRVCFHYKGKYYFVKLQQLSGAVAQLSREEESTDLCYPFYTK